MSAPTTWRAGARWGWVMPLGRAPPAFERPWADDTTPFLHTLLGGCIGEKKILDTREVCFVF